MSESWVRSEIVTTDYRSPWRDRGKRIVFLIYQFRSLTFQGYVKVVLYQNPSDIVIVSIHEVIYRIIKSSGSIVVKSLESISY